MYGFPLMFNSNKGPVKAHLRDIRLRSGKLGEIDISRSLKGKCDGVIGLPMYALLLMVNSNIGHI